MQDKSALVGFSNYIKRRKIIMSINHRDCHVLKHIKPAKPKMTFNVTVDRTPVTNEYIRVRILKMLMTNCLLWRIVDLRSVVIKMD